MNRHHRGMALLMVLMLTFLLAVLVGAFFQVHQSNFATLGAGQGRSEAMLAAESGMAYARYKLEHDQTWAASDFTGTSETLGSWKMDTVAGTRTLRGNVLDGVGQPAGTRFEIEVLNNLGAASASPGGVVPKDAVKLRAMGFSRNFKAGIEVVLLGEPLYDSAASCNGKMDMSQNRSWVIKSLDEVRNWVRSNDDIYTPDVLGDPGNRAMRFYGADESTPHKAKGLAWSRKDVYSGTSSMVSGSQFAAMNLAVDGRMAPRSTLNNDIYDLKLTDLKVDPSNLTVVPPGRFVLTESAAIPVVEHTRYVLGFPVGTYNADDPPVGIRTLTFYPEGGGSPTVHYPASELARVASEHPGTVVSVTPPAGGTVAGDTVNLAPGFDFSFSRLEFTFDDAKQYQVNGNFAVGYEAPPTTPQLPEVSPDIILMDPASPEAPAFLNVTHSFTVDGTLKGRGALAAQGDIFMRAETDLAASVDSPLVVWGGNDINIDASGRDRIKFSGLVYAKRDFNIVSASPLESVRLQGALVAREGKINVANTDKVDMTYDPSYLEALTRGLPSGRRRLKQMSWRTF